eukprot:1466724-Rhodomonas_salina.3
MLAVSTTALLEHTAVPYGVYLDAEDRALERLLGGEDGDFEVERHDGCTQRGLHDQRKHARLERRRVDGELPVEVVCRVEEHLRRVPPHQTPQLRPLSEPPVPRALAPRRGHRHSDYCARHVRVLADRDHGERFVGGRARAGRD